MSSTINVLIKKVGQRCVVVPGIIVVKPGDVVNLRNTTREIVYAQAYGLSKTFEILPRQTYALKVPVIRPGIYPVAVFCAGSKVFGWTPIPMTAPMPIIIVHR